MFLVTNENMGLCLYMCFDIFLQKNLEKEYTNMEKNNRNTPLGGLNLNLKILINLTDQ